MGRIVYSFIDIVVVIYIPLGAQTYCKNVVYPMLWASGPEAADIGQ